MKNGLISNKKYVHNNSFFNSKTGIRQSVLDCKIFSFCHLFANTWLNSSFKCNFAKNWGHDIRVENMNADTRNLSGCIDIRTLLLCFGIKIFDLNVQTRKKSWIKKNNKDLKILLTCARVKNKSLVWSSFELCQLTNPTKTFDRRPNIKYILSENISKCQSDDMMKWW